METQEMETQEMGKRNNNRANLWNHIFGKLNAHAGGEK